MAWSISRRAENLVRLILLAKQSIVCNANSNRPVSGYFAICGKDQLSWGDGDRGIREVPLASLALKYSGQSFVIELSFAFRLYANGMVHIRAARQPKRGCGRKRNGGEEVVH
jgi:hypothetical protein